MNYRMDWELEVPHLDFVLCQSILCTAVMPPIECVWFSSREAIELYPTGLISWPVEFTY